MRDEEGVAPGGGRGMAEQRSDAHFTLCKKSFSICPNKHNFKYVLSIIGWCNVIYRLVIESRIGTMKYFKVFEYFIGTLGGTLD